MCVSWGGVGCIYRVITFLLCDCVACCTGMSVVRRPSSTGTIDSALVYIILKGEVAVYEVRPVLHTQDPGLFSVDVALL